MSDTTGPFPKRYGKYELLERLGEGGMAEVFRARLPGAGGFEKIVAIKRILPHLTARTQIVKMFISEAKLTAEAQHKNIVQVFELVELEDGEFFMVMEYIKGSDLRLLLKNAARRCIRLPPWFSVYVVAEILDGLAHVHELVDDRGRPRNIIHRDVTPSNIFVSQIGEVKLGDFGIAKDAAQGKMTQAGQLKGKVSYMAPEQLYGEELDQRIDVFAAGVILWECLTQQRLYGGRAEVAAMRMICKAPRVAPSTCGPDIPKAVDECVLAALEIDRDKRISSARDFQTRLLDILPKLRGSVKPTEVRRVVEAMLGDAPAKGAGSLGVSSFSVSSKYGFSEREADEDKGLAAPAPPADSTEMDLNVEKSGVHDTVTEVPQMPGDWLVTGPQSTRMADEALRRAEADRRQVEAIGTTSNHVYEGPHPLWLSDAAGNVLGPFAVERALAMIKANAHLHLGVDARISADGQKWITIGELAKQAGLESLLHTDAARSASRGTTGNLDVKSPLMLLLELGRQRATGCLTLLPEATRSGVVREIHVLRGAPTYVFANEESLSLPELLLEKKAIKKHMLPELLHEVVKRNRSIDDLLADRSGLNARYRLMLMKERVLELPRWKLGRYIFDTTAKIDQSPPFTKSLLHLIPEIVHRGVSLEELRTALVISMNLRLDPSKDFESGMDELGFSQAQKQLGLRMQRGKKLTSLVRAHASEERMLLLVAFVLLETGFLRAS